MSRGLDLRGRGAHVRISFLLVCIAFLTLLVPALARADRGPTGLERGGIEAAAQREFGQAHAQAKVSDIRVSTKNRAWATAAVTVDNGAADQSYQAEFHRKSKGNWGPADNEMPAAVEDDLGLSDTGGSVDKVVRIGTFAVLGLLALGILWAISVGLSKLGLGGVIRSGSLRTFSGGDAAEVLDPFADEAEEDLHGLWRSGQVDLHALRRQGPDRTAKSGIGLGDHPGRVPSLRHPGWTGLQPLPRQGVD